MLVGDGKSHFHLFINIHQISHHWLIGHGKQEDIHIGVRGVMLQPLPLHNSLSITHTHTLRSVTTSSTPLTEDNPPHTPLLSSDCVPAPGSLAGL